MLSDERGTLVLLNRQTPPVVQRVPMLRPVVYVDFVPMQNRFVTADDLGTIGVWEGAPVRLLYTVPTRLGPIGQIVFAPAPALAKNA